MVTQYNVVSEISSEKNYLFVCLFVSCFVCLYVCFFLSTLHVLNVHIQAATFTLRTLAASQGTFT